jgi:hypothetical protein
MGSGGNPTAAYARIRAEQEKTNRAQLAADAKLSLQRERIASQSSLVEARASRELVRTEQERVRLRSQTLRLGQQEASIARQSVVNQERVVRAGLSNARTAVQAQQTVSRGLAQQRAALGGGAQGFLGGLLTPAQRNQGGAFGGLARGIAGLFGPGDGGQPQTARGGGLANAAGRGIRSVGVGGIAFGSLVGNLGARAVVGAGRAVGSVFGETYDAVAQNERINTSFQTLIARDLMLRNKDLSTAEALSQAQPATANLRQFVLQKAIKSPFGEADIASSFQRFQTVGFEQADARRMTSGLVDLGSAYRMEGEEMNRLAKALGDVKTRGYLSGEEVRQFINARFDVQGAVATVLGKSREEVVKLQAEKKITADTVLKAFLQTVESEPIKGSAERLAESWGGLGETFKDLRRVALRELGTGTFDALHPYVVNFSNFLQEQLASGHVREIGQQIGGFVKQGLDVGGQALERITSAWETFNRVREMGLPKTAVGMGLEALGLPADLSRLIASWSVDSVTAIQTAFTKVRSALSTYSAVKGDGGSTAYATFSALEALGLPADVATVIGNWAGEAELELGKLGGKLHKALEDGKSGSTVGLFELAGMDTDAATQVDSLVSEFVKELNGPNGLRRIPAEIEAFKKISGGDVLGGLGDLGAKPDSPVMRGLDMYHRADEFLNNLPPEMQLFGPEGQPHPLYERMGVGPNAQPPAPTMGSTEFDAYVNSLHDADQAAQAAAVSAAGLGATLPPVVEAMGGLVGVTDPANASLGGLTAAADPASVSLANIGVNGQNAALGVSALNTAASTTDIGGATEQYLALSRALYAVSGSYQTAAEQAESAKKSLEHFNMPEALVQHSPSPFEQALLDAGDAGHYFGQGITFAARGIAGASQAVRMGQADWEDFGITMGESGNVAAGLDPVDRGSLATASTMNTALAGARATTGGGARQTGPARAIKGVTPGLVAATKTPTATDLRAEAWNKRVAGAMEGVGGLTAERERGDIGRITEQYLRKLGVKPEESQTVGNYVRNAINTRRGAGGELPDLTQALEAFGTPGGDSMADEVQKFLERLGVTNDNIAGATEAITRAENGIKNQMGPVVPEATSVGQKLLKDQLEQLLTRSGVAKEAIPGQLEKLYGSGALEGLDQQMYQDRQKGIADQIANMLGGQDSKEKRARVAAIMGSGAFGEFNPDWLNTQTAMQDRQDIQDRRGANPRYADGTPVPSTGNAGAVANVQGTTAIIQVILDPDKMVDVILPAAVTRLKLQGISPTK